MTGVAVQFEVEGVGDIQKLSVVIGNEALILQVVYVTDESFHYQARFPRCREKRTEHGKCLAADCEYEYQHADPSIPAGTNVMAFSLSASIKCNFSYHRPGSDH